MVKRGLVSRQRSETDRRVVALSLTARGRALVEQLAPRVMDLWNALLSGFSHAEIDTLIALLTRLAIAADSTGKAPTLLASKSLIAKAPKAKARQTQFRKAKP
jgi:hypothetical protein